MNKFKNNMSMLDSSTLMYPRLVETTPIAFRHVIRVNRDIGDPSEWVEEISTIQNASPNDVIHITINSGGGSLYTTTEILSAIAQTQAHVITEITGECCSAATLIFLAGHEFLVSDDASFMLHSASYGAWGTESNVYDNVSHSRKQIHKLMRKYYKDFLTDAELDLMLEGKEFWMGAEEVIERLEKRNEAIQKELDVQTDSLNQLMEDESLFVVPEKEELESWSKEKLIEYILGEDEDPKEDIEDSDELEIPEDKELTKQDKYDVFGKF